tara:strand:+ start:241 stop:921 length:681 start_codon:yes stop_codon:yes gene_type:complete
MLISIITGLAAGSLHVIGGADHLVSLAPAVLAKPKTALSNGLSWGLGHSVGVILLSIVAVFAKDLVHIEKLSSFSELLVGITLLIIGAIAIKKSFGLNIHVHEHEHANGDSYAHKHIHLHFLNKKKHSSHSHAATSLGILHGMAGASHLLAVIPALALPPIAAICYLVAYLLGSIITMALFLLAISLTSIRIGKRFLRLIFGFAGGLSFVTGVFWIQKTSAQLMFI